MLWHQPRLCITSSWSGLRFLIFCTNPEQNNLYNFAPGCSRLLQ
ncbi:12002_t:CDS:1, partial [Entrophospora sp. SA101]